MLLLLQRAAETVSGDDECNDPAVLLACALGSSGCPAKCANKASEEEVNNATNINDMPIAGDLTVAVADYSSEVKSVPAKGAVIFNAVDFKASEKITIESVKLERIGLSDKSNIGGIWFEKDGVAVSAKASITTDGVATTRFYNNYSVNGTDTLDLVVELTGNRIGAEVAFKFAGVTSTAKNVSANTQTSTYRTADYSVATAKFETSGTASTSTSNNVVEYKVGEATTYEIGKFQITNEKGSSSEDRTIVLKSLKLKNNGDLDLGDTFKNVVVKRDSKVVSKSVVLDGKNMTIYFDDNELDSGKKGVYTISAEVAQLNEVNRTVWLTLNKTSELVANEKSTNFRTAVEGKDVSLRAYLFKGGKVTFSNDSSMAKTVNSAESSTDVVVAKGTINVSEPIKLSTITFKVKGDTAAAYDIIKNLKLEIGGSTYYTKKASNTCTAGNDCSYETEDSEIYISKTSDIRILVDLNNNITGTPTLTFNNFNAASLSTNGNTFENSDSTLDVSQIVAGTIQVAKLTVKAGKFNVTNKTSSTQKVVAGNSDEVVIFDGEISSREGTVSINDLVLSGVFLSAKSGDNKYYYGLPSTENITLTVYVNGDAYADATFTDHAVSAGYADVDARKTALNSLTYKTAEFSSLGDVVSGEPMRIKIVAQPNINTVGSISFKILTSGTDGNGNPVEASTVTAATLEITEKAAATIATSSATNSVVRDGSNAEIASFTATIKNGSYNLTQLDIAGTNLSSLDNVTLSIDGSDVDSTNPSSATAISFADINENLSAGKHTFTLKANTKAGATTSTSVFTLGNVTMYQDGIAEATPTDLKLTKLVANSFPTISASTNGNDLYLTIANPRDSEDDIAIKGFLVNGSIVGASLDGQTINLAAGSLKTLITAQNVSIAPDSSVKFKLEVAKAGRVEVTGIIIEEDGQTLIIDNNYKNIGDWDAFSLTSNADNLPASYWGLAVSGSADARDTTITAKP